MKKFVPIVLLLISATGFAQPTLYRGVAVLQDGTVFTGDVSILSYQLVCLGADNEQVILAPHKISQVRYYDSESNINRKFISIKTPSIVTDVYILYEEVLYGAVSVVRKPSSFYNASKLSLADHEAFDYFARTSSDKLISLKKFRSTLFPKFREELGERMENYISENHLDIYDTADVIQIIQYYNKAVAGQEVIAGL